MELVLSDIGRMASREDQWNSLCFHAGSERDWGCNGRASVHFSISARQMLEESMPLEGKSWLTPSFD